jgi:hypothetical protein
MASKSQPKRRKPVVVRDGISVSAVKGLNLNDAGSAEVLPIDLINIDPDYQRNLRHDLVERIRADWDIVKAGPILVSQRKDGTLWCVDGQHRMMGAQLAGEEEIFAHVVHGLNKEEEAALRLARNERRSDNQFEKFRTRLVMNDPKAHRIVEICHQFQTEVNTAANVHHGINAISALEVLYDIDRGSTLIKVLKTITDAYGEDSLFGRTVGVAMLKSIAWFLDRHVDTREVKYQDFVERLSAVDADDIDRKARTHKAALGGALWVNYYRAMVEIWNYRRADANKITWKTQGGMNTLGDVSKPGPRRPSSDH